MLIDDIAFILQESLHSELGLAPRDYSVSFSFLAIFKLMLELLGCSYCARSRGSCLRAGDDKPFVV